MDSKIGAYQERSFANYYVGPARQFSLFASKETPSWRPPQLAALGAIIAQWSLAEGEPPLVSVPTGVGKTAIALAAPFLASASRVLVVVPTCELRKQTAERFSTQDVLLKIGALPQNSGPPLVIEAEGRDDDWNRFDDADVVVGLPASISPVHFPKSLPPRDLFDLVIIDEAHHAPAKTWLAILNHFEGHALLLTATPHRRDRRRLPGKLVYYYPLRQALDDGLFQPVSPHIIDIQEGDSPEEIDQKVVDKTVQILGEPEHATSQVMIRARSKARARELSDLYSAAGHDFPVLHSGFGRARQQQTIESLRRGEIRGVVMVGMLVEGFDLSSLRIAAYHDKHKSLEPTVQLIGRLARVDPDYPQVSALVTANDIDVFPQLQGAIRELYAEDHDWSTVLPGIIDSLVEDDLADSAYARLFEPSVSRVDPACIHPLRRAKIFEINSEALWEPSFRNEDDWEKLRVGSTFAREQVLYAGVSPDRNTLLIVTRQQTRPRWNSQDNLDSIAYTLHVVSFRPSTQSNLPDLLFVNTDSRLAESALLEEVGAVDVVRHGNVSNLQSAFDSLKRTSVSSVGVRNTFGTTRGSPSYKMFAGSSIESGIRDTDTAQTALGHAMVQVNAAGGSFTAGISTGKGKYWETRYTPLRLYEEFISDLASRYWYPPAPPSGPLLPQINRGARLASWPSVGILAVTLDHALFGSEWTVPGHGDLDALEILAGDSAIEAGAQPSTDDARLVLAAVKTNTSAPVMIWSGEIDTQGIVTSSSAELNVQRGHGNPHLFSELLTERPPTIFFVNGTTVRGAEVFTRNTSVLSLPSGLVLEENWAGVDITAETKAKAESNGRGISVHEWLEAYLSKRPRRSGHPRRRWILLNDGAGEIADYIVVELMETGQVAVGLWHAKYSGGSLPSVRVTDFEVVSAQAIKSRRWPTDRELWNQLGARLSGSAHPVATLIEGGRRALEILLGLHPRWERLSLNVRRPSVIGQIGIVQPGLSKAKLETDLAKRTASSLQVAQLLIATKDAVFSVAETTVLVSN